MTHGTAGVKTGMCPVRLIVVLSNLDEKYQATWNVLSCGRCGWLPFQWLVWHAGWLTWLSQNTATNSIYPQLAVNLALGPGPCTICTE